MKLKLNIKKTVMLSLLTSSVVLFSGCTNHQTPSSGAYGSVGADGVSQEGYEGSLDSQGLDGENGFISDQTDTSHMTQAQLLDITTYHFQYDSAQILANNKPAIIAQAHYLANHPDKRILLAGNTDSRGSREYNVALGLRRAQSVEKLMLLNGARRSQIMVTSYGEEKPVAFGDSQAAFEQNRRVDLTYEN